MLVALILAAIFASSALAAPALAKTINGNAGPNVLVGTNRADIIHGKAGGDTLRGKGSADRLYGDEGYDKIYGGGGEDRIYGGDQNDTLRGGAGNDRIFTAGEIRDVVDCGRGKRDLAEVDPRDTVKNCERVRMEPTVTP
jgi:Ca2+-binding RTX toxin-like protein